MGQRHAAVVRDVLAATACLLLLACTARTETTSPPAIQGLASETMPSADQRMPAQGNPGPWDQDVLVFRVDAAGAVTKTATFERAGVATIIRMSDGRLLAAHQHFPADDPASFDKVAVRFSSDEGRTWAGPHVIRVDGLPGGMRFPFDPTLVLLPDGRIRLYFTSLRGQRPEEDVPAIYSAISTNGIDYTFEPGIRFSVPGRPVIDCAVVLHRGVFHIYAPDNGTRINASDSRSPNPGAGYHATSADGLSFTRVSDVKMDDTRRWLGGAQSDGEAITFWGTQDSVGLARAPGTSRSGVWLAKSTDGADWKLLNAPVVNGADPGAVATRQGGWVVVATGPPRPGTPSERRSRN